MIDAIGITIQGVGYAIFNSLFIMGIWLIYVINKRLNVLDFYRTRNFRPFIFKISDILLEGILIGTVTSIVLVVIGVPLYFNDLLLFLTPIALVLGLYRLRMLCISYAASLMALIALTFSDVTLFGVTFPTLELHVPSLLILVGLLHLIEGMLVQLTSAKTAIPIISQHKDQVFMGHIIQKNWLIPLSLLVIQLGILSSGGVEMPEWWPLIVVKTENPIFYTLLPLVGFLSYSTITYSDTPKKKSFVSGLYIMAFGLMLIVIGVVSMESRLIQYIGSILMFAVHECINYLERYREIKKQPIYTVPSNGIRIMQIIEGGLAERLGMKKGDVIEKINNIVVKDIQHFIHLVREAKDNIVIGSLTLSGQNKEYKIDTVEQMEQIGIRVIPEKPLILYPYNQLSEIGLYEFLRRNMKKED